MYTLCLASRKIVTNNRFCYKTMIAFHAIEFTWSKPILFRFYFIFIFIFLTMRILHLFHLVLGVPTAIAGRNELFRFNQRWTIHWTIRVPWRFWRTITQRSASLIPKWSLELLLLYNALLCRKSNDISIGFLLLLNEYHFAQLGWLLHVILR